MSEWWDAPLPDVVGAAGSGSVVAAMQFGCRPCDIWFALEVGYPDSLDSLAIILATLPRSQNQADPTQASPHSLQ